MNLMDFHDKLTFDSHSGIAPGYANHFSEQVTMFNVLNGTFPDEDIINIRANRGNDSLFKVQLRTESIAKHAAENLDGMVVPGAYKPLYKLEVGREKDTLIFKMNEIK